MSVEIKSNSDVSGRSLTIKPAGYNETSAPDVYDEYWNMTNHENENRL